MFPSVKSLFHTGNILDYCCFNQLLTGNYKACDASQTILCKQLFYIFTAWLNRISTRSDDQLSEQFCGQSFSTILNQIQANAAFLQDIFWSSWIELWSVQIFSPILNCKCIHEGRTREFSFISSYPLYLISDKTFHSVHSFSSCWIGVSVKLSQRSIRLPLRQ